MKMGLRIDAKTGLKVLLADVLGMGGEGVAEEGSLYLVTDEAETFEAGVDLFMDNVFCIELRHVLAVISLIRTQTGF